MKVEKHETRYNPKNTPMGQLEYLTNLWDEVCYEQEGNDYSWRRTKEKLLSDWESYETMSLDFWIAYMQESILCAAKEVVYQSKKSTSGQKH